jgi:Ca2+-transporting ATPase
MSIIPEEIPVAFTTFMALGVWRMMKVGIVVKEIKTVETLGSASVICTDKTGTLTENKMSIAKVFTLANRKFLSIEEITNNIEQELISLSMWASEPIPFDPMEVAIHNAYLNLNIGDERKGYKMLHEYPLGGKPPMMTHIFENNEGGRYIAAKGAPEAIIAVSNLNQSEINEVLEAVKTLAKEGYRILGVAESDFVGNDFPATQQEFKFNFKGLIAFYDPPKKNISKVLEDFHIAGIDVKIITGDNAETTSAIAKQIGFINFDKSIDGNDLMNLNDEDFAVKVKEMGIFTRMFPEAKLKIIDFLKKQNEIVAMVGDGVNDGPALKAAHIGIAMGKKGTEIAKQAASLVLLDDDLSKMIDAIAMGRRIYSNLKKAIQYIISIHLPIILIVVMPLALGWIYPNIFSPVHIIFLELIMGPTCSIVFENEPMEEFAMQQKPRPFTTTFFNVKELSTSILQGIFISIGLMIVYQYSVINGYNESITRTMVFTALIVANLFLTLVNRSFYYSILTTLRYKNNLLGLILGVTIIITGLLVYVQPMTRFFEFEALNVTQISFSTGVGFLFVIWFEIVKWFKRREEL